METRGQRLDPHDCIDYYCNQQGGKGTYFASNYPIQRGYGLFSNLKRYAMPIMIKAGKYLGKHLLTTGQNVLEDMSRGKSFREASRNQFRQAGNEIKQDILRKLRGGGDRSSFVEVHPVASISDNNTIEFLISGLGESYFDLSHLFLHVQSKILKVNGEAFQDADRCGPVNYLLNTMFSECHVSLNDRQISSENNYAYKAYIQSILFHPEGSQKNLLSAGLFEKDTAGEFDDVSLLDVGKNIGLKKRWDRVKNGKVFDMCGILHTDLGTQSKLLINGTSIRIKLLKAKNEFALLAAAGDYRIQIENISLYIRKCEISSSILVAHEKALEQSLVQMPFTRTEIKTFTLSSGLKSITIPNAVNGTLPTRMILGLISNSAYTGDLKKNPLILKIIS
ncbi:uncharacterized protein TNCV_394631 [Trichonephila clavipes]|nr:uncharacterized protein TNCV_394631 [Trichonephila clavipes]